ncbi:Transcription initiation factor IIE subunit beta [Ceratobasidium theobromae]|uniref:Transcription initiation factor IIE subunit beta n=1 Tax=Ceratobasidium theobromae TaxID=1582974 RepID=A0A5N5QEF0_9AGAM|nr:Transcription initiation factor IIE subunit beta [Ceratobasidium theobromae]
MSSNPSSFPLRPGVAPRTNAISLPTAGSAPSTSQAKDSKKRVKAEIFSQPKDTGSGTQKGTQLSYLIAALRERKGPIRLEDLGAHAGVPDIENDPILIKALNEHERVTVDPRLKLYTWRPDFQVKDKHTVLGEVTRHARGGAGVSIKALKESWAGAVQAVEELEKEGLVLVTRSAKDDHMKMVFRNDVTPEMGGKKVDDEFVKLWHGLVVPPEADMLKALESVFTTCITIHPHPFDHSPTEGLQITTAESSAKTTGPQKKKGKKSAPRQRPVKITNTHLQGIDLSKDYAPPPKEDA